MTLIANFVVADTLVWVGDLLVSEETTQAFPIATPLVDDANDYSPARRFYMRDMVQKLNLLSDRLLVGCAGSLAQAKDILSTLANIAATPDLTPEFLDSVLDAIEPRRMDELSLLIALIAPPPASPLATYCISLHADRRHGGAFGWVTVAGTGRDTFMRDLEPFARQRELLPSIKKPAQKASCVGLMLASRFYGREFSSKTNLIEAWGGGFEVIVRREGQFKKLDNVVYLFWSVIESPSGTHTLQLMHKLIKSQYHGDALLLRVLEMIENEDGELETKDDFHFIPPILKSSRNYDVEAIPRPSFACNFICSFILESQIGAPTQNIFSRVSFEPEGIKEFDCEIRDGVLQLSVPRQLTEDIRRMVKDVCGYDVNRTSVFIKKRK